MNCVCKLKSGIQMYDLPQSFRFVGTDILSPRPFTDVKIGTKTIPALMDTSRTQSSIDETLARFVLNLNMFDHSHEAIPSEVKVKIEIDDVKLPLKCKVRKLEPGVHMYLGMDFYFCYPFDLTINRVTLNSQNYWNTTHHEEIDFVYNHLRGRFLKRKLLDIQYEPFKTKYFRRF